MSSNWKRAYLTVIIALGFCLALAAIAVAQLRPLDQDVFTPLTKGYDLMRDGKYEAAEFEFKTALQKDRYNPFALNNMAALAERQGKLKDAMAYLTDAATHAKEYGSKFEQICFPGGLCTAVKPVKEVGPTSTIAPVIAENTQKLHAKIAATPEKPVPAAPPPMDIKKPEKEKGK